MTFHVRAPWRCAAAVAAAALLLLAFTARCSGVEERRDTVLLTILHTNDMHGRVDGRPMGSEKEQWGGLARVAAEAARVRREVEGKGGFAVLVDAGDFYAGTPEGNMTRGRIVVQTMNAAGYEIAAIGNHEFDDGLENLESLSSLARFPMSACNLKLKGKDRPRWARDYVPRDFGNFRAAFVGIAPTDTGMISSGAGEFEFEDEAVSARRAAARAKGEGALLCIALSHAGFERDRELSEALPEFALIVGGHSHTTLKKGWRNENTGSLVVQAGWGATYLGRVDLEIERSTGKVLKADARIVPLRAGEAPESPDVKAALDAVAADIRKEMDVVLGESERELERGGRFLCASSPLGNLIADLIRDAGGAQLGFQNRGGVREVMPAGPVTMRRVFEICPFGNTVVAMDLTGKDLLDLMETSLRERDRFLLEVSGMEVEYDPDAAPGSKVRSITVGGKPLDPSATYRAATNSFLAAGGDGHPALLRGTSRKDTGVYLRDCLARAIKDRSPLKYEHRNRIRKKKDGD